MVRRQEPTELVSGRDRLRELAAAQQDALSEFWQAAARGDQLRAEMEAIEAEQRRHAAALAGLLGAATAAELTGWSKARIADALRVGRATAHDTADDGEFGATALRPMS